MELHQAPWKIPSLVGSGHMGEASEDLEHFGEAEASEAQRPLFEGRAFWEDGET